MKLIGGVCATLCVGVLSAIPFAACAEDSASLGPIEAISIAVDAYVYGYPLVTFDTVRKQQTNVAKQDSEHAPTVMREHAIDSGRPPDEAIDRS